MPYTVQGTLLALDRRKPEGQRVKLTKILSSSDISIDEWISRIYFAELIGPENPFLAQAGLENDRCGTKIKFERQRSPAELRSHAQIVFSLRVLLIAPSTEWPTNQDHSRKILKEFRDVFILGLSSHFVQRIRTSNGC